MSDAAGRSVAATSELDEDVIIDIDPEEDPDSLVHEINSYGADFDVRGMVERLRNGEIVIPRFQPESESQYGVRGFQRSFIWPPSMRGKFIESILMGLPVPGLFLVRTPDAKFLVLDGQQRLMTLRVFFDGDLKLSGTQERFEGLTYDQLSEDMQRRIGNYIIHSTIIRLDEALNRNEALYQIFERINSTGRTLNPHEIRVALYGGPFINLLRDLSATSDDWKLLVGRPQRLKDQELILRFFALTYRHEEYKRPMKTFLNDFAACNRELQEIGGAKLRDVFTEVVSVIVDRIGDYAFRLRRGRAVNAAVLDSVMVGVAQNLSFLRQMGDNGALEERHGELIERPDYLESVTSGTSDDESVRTRLELARDAFDLRDA